MGFEPTSQDLGAPPAAPSTAISRRELLSFDFARPAETAGHLRTYLAGRPTGRPAWGGSWHAGRRSAEMIRLDLEAAGIPAGPINDLQQVFADPQVIHRGMRLELKSPAAKGGIIPGIRTPIVLDGAPMASERPSPRLGEHTAEILREIGEG